MFRLPLVVVAFCFSIGCSETSPNSGRLESPVSSEASLADRSAELPEVFEALFRYQFQHNASGVQQEARAYFLAIEEKDPAVEFLKRFAGETPPVKKGSQCVVGQGLKFRIDSWKWISENKVEISGGYYEGGLSSSGNQYTLERKEGQWKVEAEAEDMEWIS